jgi:small GTP-binding protein
MKPVAGTEPLRLNGGIHKNFLNICLIGDSGVGKTCLLKRFVGGGFPPTVVVTTIDLFITQHIMENGESISIRLWDTAGLEQYAPLTGASIRQSEAAVLVYDESVPQSLEKLTSIWYPLVKEFCPKLRHILVVGNKNDKLTTADVHERLSKQLELLGDKSRGHWSSFVSVSAMKDDTISLQHVFHHFCTRVLKNIKEADPGHYQDFLLIKH